MPRPFQPYSRTYANRRPKLTPSSGRIWLPGSSLSSKVRASADSSYTKMWLLQVTTKKLGYFEGRNCPKYAILSHRWEEEEVLYQDIIDGTAHSKNGYTKIERTCQQAENDGFEYVWIDTCCIDKKSSAELSEAINSMYRWYQRAEVCYAFLSDVRKQTSTDVASSVWFTRGWTLQELLAPRHLVFYDSTWTLIGCKDKMGAVIHKATSIPRQALGDFQPNLWPIAAKMSWAARRNTTRLEDQAYCLLGLFQVNMPLLYGEGPNAFVRLQEELCKIYTDRSIFAWNRGEEALRFFREEYDTGNLERSAAFFAPSVICFDVNFLPEGFAPILSYPFFSYPISSGGEQDFEWRGARTIAVTNEGMSIEVRLRPFFYGVYLAELCYPMPSKEPNYILLQQTDSNGPLRYQRVVLNGAWAFVGQSQHFDEKIARLCTKTITVLRETPIHYTLDFLEKIERCQLHISIDTSYCLRFRPTSQNTITGNRRNRGRSGAGHKLHIEHDLDDLIFQIKVPWQQSVGLFGCVYFPHPITNELLLLFMGYDYDFEPLSVLQIWPNNFDRKIRSLYGLQTSGCGTKRVYVSDTVYIDCRIAFGRPGTDVSHTSVEFGKETYNFNTVLRTYVFKNRLPLVVHESKGPSYPRVDRFRSHHRLVDTRPEPYPLVEVTYRNVPGYDSRSIACRHLTEGKLLVCDQLGDLTEWVDVELAERNKSTTQGSQKDSIPLRYLIGSTETSSERGLPRSYSYMS